MNQALEIDRRSGFNPQEESHLLWVIRSRLKKAEARATKYNNKRAVAEDPNMEVSYSERCERALGAVFELQGLLGMIDNEVFPAYYCSRCGYLDSDEVTYDGRCTKCGGVLPI